MATCYRARVCAVGTEMDIRRLLAVMLDNYGSLEPSDDRPLPAAASLAGEISRIAGEDGGEGDTFLYEMVAFNRYGEAIPATCRLWVRPAGETLWTALFDYQSEDAFQIHDWLELHNRSGRIPMMALRAAEDLALDKGSVVFLGGKAAENWDAMLETWLWLMKEYYCGRPTEEAVASLEQVERQLREEEYDQDVAELLASCEENLDLVLPQPEDWDAELAAAQEKQDFGETAMLRLRWAEAALWETDHIAKWQACLTALREAWLEAHPGNRPDEERYRR